MAKKSPAAPAHRVGTGSKLRAGTGSKRIKTRLIWVYGLPKAGKTTTCSTLPVGRTKWLVSDSNCVPLLTFLDRLPADEDIYELKSVMEARTLINEMLTLAEENNGALDFDYACLDSITQFVDWHQQDVATETNQKYLGDNAKNNGWQQFNTEFGALLDDLAKLARYVTVVVIAHSKEKPPNAGKSEWGGLNLPPQMAVKAGRLANWVLLKTLSEVFGEDVQESDFIRLFEENGEKHFFESALYTKPVGNWFASCNGKLSVKEPGDDITKLLGKDGLL